MEQINKLSELVIGAAMEVHKHLGPGLLESAYQRALEIELGLRGIPFRAQLQCPVVYKGSQLEDCYRIDLLVDESLVVELKAVSAIEDVHEAQILTYLQFSKCRVGLILNFHKKHSEKVFVGFLCELHPLCSLCPKFSVNNSIFP